MAAKKKSKVRSAKASAARVDTRHPAPQRQGARISAEKYEAVKKAILAALPKDPPGFSFKDLPAAVARRVPASVFEGASITWYTVRVKLDLEARGLVARLPGSRPQRLVRLD